MEFHDEDIGALFHACRSYQQANRSQNRRSISDQAFLDAVREYHEAKGEKKLASALPDTSSFNRHKNGAQPKGKNTQLYITALAQFLEDVGYWPFDARFEAQANAVCNFFGARLGGRSAAMLSEVVGQYLCYQKSSWFADHVLISTFSFTAASDSEHPFLMVSEQQATGRDVADAHGIIETVENFTGIAFGRQNMMYMMLKEDRMQTPKFCLIYQVLPNLQDRPASFLQGYTLKGSNSPNAKLHLTRLLMERIEDAPPLDGRENGATGDVESPSQLMTEARFKELHPRFHRRLYEIPLTEL